MKSITKAKRIKSVVLSLALFITSVAAIPCIHAVADTKDTQFEAQMKAAGFPTTYLASLNALHKKYPNGRPTIALIPDKITDWRKYMEIICFLLEPLLFNNAISFCSKSSICREIIKINANNNANTGICKINNVVVTFFAAV